MSIDSIVYAIGLPDEQATTALPLDVIEELCDVAREGGATVVHSEWMLKALVHCGHIDVTDDKRAGTKVQIAHALGRLLGKGTKAKGGLMLYTLGTKGGAA